MLGLKLKRRASSYTEAFQKFQSTADYQFDKLQIHSDYKISLANTLSKRKEAFELVNEVYQEIGLFNSGANQLVQEYDKSSNTIIFVAHDNDNNMIGTVTLTQGDGLQMPSEGAYAEEFGTYKAGGKKIAEVTRLAIKNDYRQSMKLIMSMFYHVYIESCFHFELDELVLVVNARHTSFYKNYMGMAEIGSSRPCARVENAMGVLMKFDLANVNDQNIEIREKTNFINKSYVRFIKAYPYSLKDEHVILDYYNEQMVPFSPSEEKYFKI